MFFSAARSVPHGNRRIDRDIEPSRPDPDHNAGRDRNTARHGHRRKFDAKHPRRDFSDRVNGVAAFRVVALSDLIIDGVGMADSCR